MSDSQGQTLTNSRNDEPLTQASLIERHQAVIPDWVALYYQQPIEIVSGSGSRVTDGDGRTYLDFFAGIVTNTLGYDVAEVREAVERQLRTGVVHTSTLYLLRGQVELAEKIARLSGIENAKVFFTNSGTEANETALLLATYVRKSNQVLAMRQSYHGRSFGAISITANRTWKNSGLSPLTVYFLHGGDRHLPQFSGLSDTDFVKVCVEDLRHTLATVTAGDVAAFVVEPVQGIGGYTYPPNGLYRAYKEVFDEYGILFISDEVQTGWGRTGSSFWGIGNHGVTPDMMTFAKGLGNGFAIGGVVARGELMDAPHAAGISTFGGNPIATAAGNATLDYIVDHDLQANAATVGGLIIEGLRAAEARLPIVTDVRGMGLMFAIELRDAALAARMLEETKARGLLVGKGGLYGNTIRMAPPMTLSEDEGKEGLDILIDSLEAINEDATS